MLKLLISNIFIRWREHKERHNFLFPHECELIKGKKKMTLEELLDRLIGEDKYKIPRVDKNLIVKIEYLDDELFDIAEVRFDYEKRTIIIEVD